MTSGERCQLLLSLSSLAPANAVFLCVSHTIVRRNVKKWNLKIYAHPSHFLETRGAMVDAPNELEGA